MTRLHDLGHQGQSPWFDFIRRSFTRSGELQRLIENGVRGVTSNPSIFEKAIGGSDDYDGDFRELVHAGATASDVYDTLSLKDIAEAADLFRSLYDDSARTDGFVSIEVSPELAHDTDGTIADARRIYAALARPNVMIKVPGTPAGIPAIETLIGEGINVNVTLIFSTSQYEPVALAYISGLEKFAANGGDVTRVASVASFFVSRVDTLVDRRLAAAARSDFAGKAAIANAQAAYARFLEIFSGQRWDALLAKGARVQRPLWASTGTKDPAYPDTLYVDSLVARDTVNTLPPATLAAVVDHGQTEPSLVDGIPAGLTVLAELLSIGIDVDGDVAQALQDDGVKLFADAFSGLMKAIGEKRERYLASGRGTTVALGEHQAAIDAALLELDAARVLPRMWAKDHTVFQQDPAEVANRLGWLSVMDEVAADIASIEAFVADVRAAGFTRAVLLGMGGSSLAPEMFRKVFGVAPGFLELEVLDSTAPAAVRALTDRVDPATTLFIVSTKSGGTVETFSLFKHFYNVVQAAVPGALAGEHFVAITDAGSALETLAKNLGFRRTFLANPDIGGRYSALSHFGIVPAALVGADVRRLLASGSAAARASTVAGSAADAPGVLLGVVLGELAKAGRDKATLLLSPQLESFGDWAEQLIAESTGKAGRGILPVVGEGALADDAYGNDRVFVTLRIASDTGTGPNEALAAKHPNVTITVVDAYDIGGQIFECEFATAIAGQRLGINPFDQPNVESAKVVAREMVAAYTRDGELPSLNPAFVDAAVTVYGDVETDNLAGAISGFLGHATSADGTRPYVSLQAYLPPTSDTSNQLQQIRTRIEESLTMATTVAYGPRFLHSTGQLHKGDGGNGLFIQFVDRPAVDAPIPDEAGEAASSFSFGTLIAAQSLGDRQALLDNGRRVLRLDFGADIASGLAAVFAAI